MPTHSCDRQTKEVMPAAQGCATLVSAATCGAVLLMLLVVVVIQLFVSPAVGASLAERGTDAPALTGFVLSIPWWVTLLAGLMIAAFAVAKEVAISHALANLLINLLLLLLAAGTGVVLVVALTLPYVIGKTPGG